MVRPATTQWWRPTRAQREEELVRTVVVSNIVSLDGSFEGPGGDVMALNMDAAFDAYNLERIRSAGTVLLGRRSFEGFSSYWPHIADAPHDPANRALSDDNRELSRLYDPLPKIVISDGLVVPADNPWHGVTTVVPRAAAATRVTAEKQRGRGDILVFASRPMWNGLRAPGGVGGGRRPPAPAPPRPPGSPPRSSAGPVTSWSSPAGPCGTGCSPRGWSTRSTSWSVPGCSQVGRRPWTGPSTCARPTPAAPRGPRTSCSATPSLGDFARRCQASRSLHPRSRRAPPRRAARSAHALP